MNPGIESGLAAEIVATVPGLQQGFLHRVRGQVRIARDAQAGVVPTPAALVEHGLEGVRLGPGFEKGKHGTWTAGREKVRSRPLESLRCPTSGAGVATPP